MSHVKIYASRGPKFDELLFDGELATVPRQGEFVELWTGRCGPVLNVSHVIAEDGSAVVMVTLR